MIIKTKPHDWYLERIGAKVSASKITTPIHAICYSKEFLESRAFLCTDIKVLNKCEKSITEAKYYHMTEDLWIPKICVNNYDD